MPLIILYIYLHIYKKTYYSSNHYSKATVGNYFYKPRSVTSPTEPHFLFVLYCCRLRTVHSGLVRKSIITKPVSAMTESYFPRKTQKMIYDSKNVIVNNTKYNQKTDLNNCIRERGRVELLWQAHIYFANGRITSSTRSSFVQQSINPGRQEIDEGPTYSCSVVRELSAKDQRRSGVVLSSLRLCILFILYGNYMI